MTAFLGPGATRHERQHDGLVKHGDVKTYTDLAVTDNDAFRALMGIRCATLISTWPLMSNVSSLISEGRPSRKTYSGSGLFHLESEKRRYRQCEGDELDDNGRRATASGHDAFYDIGAGHGGRCCAVELSRRAQQRMRAKVMELQSKVVLMEEKKEKRKSGSTRVHRTTTTTRGLAGASA